jgi:uncharacterized protein (TIGR03067 family)
MKRLVLTVMSVGLLGVATWSFAADEDAVKKEYARFEGTWKITSLEAEGKKMPENVFKTSRLILKGKRFVHKEGEISLEGTFKVDLSKKPKRIDVTFTSGPEAGKTLLGIYELEGDTYRVCMGMPGKDRPKTFASKANSGHVLEVFKREKPPAREK